MKRVVSVSIGSSKRDHTATVNVLGEEVHIERIGTNGDIARAIDIIKSLDGKVDAFGMGGTDLYFVAGHKRYLLRDSIKIARAAENTPIVDGSWLKGIIERRAVEYIRDEKGVQLRGRNALVVCAIDRFGMAEALAESGCNMRYGDLAFALGIPFWLRSLRALDLAATILMPVISWIPIKYLYPTGKEQDVIKPKYREAYEWADIIGGDCHFIKRHMPEKLEGKIIITNTVTADDVEAFRKRRVKMLVTSTPELDGRSYGTNVLEAVLTAVTGKKAEELGVEKVLELMGQVGFIPRIEYLN
ncbi:MAG: quinate 5-dehydrogenase [Firmicutes bacterium]|nr:quinate 5-dehydrogenase [Bacillota bacterium]